MRLAKLVNSLEGPPQAGIVSPATAASFKHEANAKLSENRNQAASINSLVQ